ncbi:hypothetical protein ACROYT_G020251 [Oculina patagonica]
MAGSSARKESEIVQVLKDASSVREIENKYRHIAIKDIQQETDFSACVVKGEITTVYPSVVTSRGRMMKVSLKDVGDDDQSRCGNDSGPRRAISVFLKGNFVDSFKIAKERDVLVITGAQVEKSSRDGHRFNIIADESNEALKIWIIQEPVIKNKTTTNGGGAEFRTTAHSASDGGNNESPSKRSRLDLQPKAAAVYTKLADLKVNSVVNVYGVVKFFKSPFKTKGSDFVCTLSLVDPSLDSLEQSFKLVLFSKSKDTLPLVRSVGDIVCFHQIAVSEFKGELQGKFLPQSSWLVFDIDSLDTSQARSSSSRSYNLTDREKDIIEELRSWASQKESLNKKFAITNLKDLRTSQLFINLLCQVVSKSYTESGNGIVLTLWDGSLPACQSIQVEPISEQGRLTSDDLLQKSGGRCVEVFLYDNHVEGDVRNIRPGDFVCIRNVHLKEIKCDASSTIDEPKVSLIVHRGTICGRGVEILSASDPVVSLSTTVKLISEAEASVNKQKQQADVIKSKEMELEGDNRPTATGSCVTQEKSSEINENRNQSYVTNEVTTEVNRALQTSCTITEHPCIPFTSLKDIKACATVPYKFRCRVKAVMYLPSDVKNFVRRSCQSCKYLLAESPGKSPSSGVNSSALVLCPQCNQETSLVYLFSFILEDESGLLHAMVFDSDVATFFPELPSPEDFLDQSNLQETVHEWMVYMTQNPANSIEFINQDPGGNKRPWLELCILSYFPNENQDCKKVLYRVFDSTSVTDN